MENQLRITPTLIEGADDHRDSQRLGSRDRGNHRRFAGASFADALMILFVVGPFGMLIATWPIALVQAFKNIADVAECVSSPKNSRMSPLGGESIFDGRIGFCALIFGVAVAESQAPG